ncbi:MAG: PleD family two-component system response regulator [Pseudomonadota bacterium]
MSARILIVDDIPANVKVLEARLLAEYFQVLSASNGPDAIEVCEKGLCDIVLLDVMMPGMDGFEVCERLKSNPATRHIPVVMVTALDQPEDRIQGLRVGADDFLTKPVSELALITRVKSLARIKLLTDELRMRVDSGADSSAMTDLIEASEEKAERQADILLIDDNASSYERIVRSLAREHAVEVVTQSQDALFKAADGGHDIIIVSLSIKNSDALRLCSQLRSLERTRQTPIIIITGENDEARLIRGLDIGVNDYIHRPVDGNELLARVRTQMRRKAFTDALRNSMQATVEMAVTDGLTGLFNRRYFDSHLATILNRATARNKPLTVLLTDIDHFKAVNDTYGHQAGDDVLKEFAARIKRNIRTVDLACRYGGEEFAIVMPDTDMALAKVVAERLRIEIASHPFIIDGGKQQIPVTVSVGLASLGGKLENADGIVHRADTALYEAKRNGRNQIQIAQAA